MKLPRSVSGRELVKALEKLGYQITRQVGSHIRLQHEEHSVTVPDHNPIAVGTLSAVVNAVADHLGLTREEVAMRLFR
jgi:predicted RNA binding protein YcfA (HicA-like mRNA interferase family)